MRRLVKAAVILIRPAYWRGAVHRVAAAVEHERIPFANDFATVIDAGASRGQFALVARRMFPSATLHCFEPLAAPRRTLGRIVGDLVTVHGFALGEASGFATMHVAGDDDSSSVLPLSAKQVLEFPATREVGTERVEIRRLDEVLADIQRPSLLKIDVQGAELAVLRGADSLLASLDEILVECSFVELYEGQALVGDVIAYLSGKGFRLAGVHGAVRARSGEMLQADLHFGRPE